MLEQRAHRRHVIAGLTVVAGGSVQCVLVDVSFSGARLRSKGYLPETFYLVLRPGLKRWCKVMWRRSDEVGVRFVRAPAEAADTGATSASVTSPGPSR